MSMTSLGCCLYFIPNLILDVNVAMHCQIIHYFPKKKIVITMFVLIRRKRINLNHFLYKETFASEQSIKNSYIRQQKL
jgi:hypothetical protein